MKSSSLIKEEAKDEIEHVPVELNFPPITDAELEDFVSTAVWLLSVIKEQEGLISNDI
jgi:hypothetical protein